MQLGEFVHVRGELLVQLGHLLRTPVRADSSAQFSAFLGSEPVRQLVSVGKSERQVCVRHVILPTVILFTIDRRSSTTISFYV
jgi:hypothetical protein